MVILKPLVFVNWIVNDSISRSLKLTGLIIRIAFLFQVHVENIGIKNAILHYKPSEAGIISLIS